MINAEGGSRRTPSLYCRKSGFSTFARNTCIFFVGLATFYKILVFPTGGAGYRGSRYATAILIAFSSFHQRMCCMPETLLSIISNSICVCRTNKKRPDKHFVRYSSY
mgnify:CR=1 FL=1